MKPRQLPLNASMWRAMWSRRELPFFLARSAARFGDLTQLRPTVWLAAHPELVRQILVENPTKWSKARGIEKTARLLGDGLLGSSGGKHRAHRRLLQPLFSPSRLPFYAGTIVESALEMRASWRGGDVVDMHEQMSKLALRIVARAVFGTVLDSETDRINIALDEAMILFNGAMTPVGDWYEALPPIKRRFAQMRGELDSVVYGLLEQKRRAGAAGEDALCVLLRARGEDGAPLTDEEMRDEAMALLLAGHETTANALTFAWWFLGRHSKARARLDEELRAVLGERAAPVEERLVASNQHRAPDERAASGQWAANSNGCPGTSDEGDSTSSPTDELSSHNPPGTSDEGDNAPGARGMVLEQRAAVWHDVEKLTWTRAVLQETMRLLPPAWIVARRSLEDLELESNGRRIAVPQGTTVFVSPFVLHRDRRFWPDARSFKPERWAGAFVPAKWSYLPFGAGHRACLAENFAWMEAILCLSTLAQEFHAVPVAPLSLEASVTLRPRGPLLMRLEKR